MSQDDPFRLYRDAGEDDPSRSSRGAIQDDPLISSRGAIQDDPLRLHRDVTRRAFLQGTAKAVSAIAVMDVLFGCGTDDSPGNGDDDDASATVEPSPEVNYPEPKTELDIALEVNGQTYNVTVEPRATLAEVLRDTLGLTGTKVGCNRGSCGACTVHMDGLPVLSCSILAVEATGHSIETIESLAEGDTLHPLQEAFVRNDAMQCGFCTSGMIMSCKALLDTNSAPTEADVRAAVSGNLCRCGTYPRVFQATLDAAGGNG